MATQSCEMGFVDLVPLGHCAQTVSAFGLPSVRILPDEHFVYAVQVVASLPALKKPSSQATQLLSVVAEPGEEIFVPGRQTFCSLQLFWSGTSL